MSGFFAALERARARVPALPGAPLAAEDLPWLRLWQGLEARLADRPRKVVQIAACAEGERDPAVCARLAALAGRSMGGRPGGGGVVVLGGGPGEDGDDGVAHGPLPGRGSDARALDPRLLAAYWRRLLEQANLVIVDSPPVLASPLALAMAPTVDGVVLVVEAERTRTAVAAAARDALRAGGANLLGVVLNRRRFHVPSALWRRL